MFAVTVTLTLHPSAADTFLPLMLRNATASLRNEPDCHVFDVATDPDRPEDVFLYELYTDAEAFSVHLATPHFTEFDRATVDMIASKEVRTYSEVQR